MTTKDITEKMSKIRKRERELMCDLKADLPDVEQGDLYELIYPQMKKEFGKKVMDQYEDYRIKKLEKIIKKA